MRNLIFLTCFLVNFNTLFGQGGTNNNVKQLVDTATTKYFPTLTNAVISSDGNYVSIVSYENTQSQSIRILVIRASFSDWQKEIADGSLLCFSSDNKKAYYTVHDSLFSMVLGSNQRMLIASEIVVCKKASPSGCEWIGFSKKSINTRLFLFNVISESSVTYDNVVDFSFSNSGMSLIIKIELNEGDNSKFVIKWFNLANGVNKTVWFGPVINVKQLIFDEQESRLAFLVESKIGARSDYKIWSFNINEEKAILIVADGLLHEDSNLTVSNQPLIFSKDGTKLYFSYTSKSPIKIAQGVDVWSYLDPVMQSQQLADVKNDANRFSRAVIALNSHRIVLLESNGFRIIGSIQNTTGNRIVLVNESKGNTEWNWNQTHLNNVYAMNIENETRIKVCSNVKSQYISYLFHLSLNEVNVVYYNNILRSWYSFDLLSGTTRNIAKGIKTDWSIIKEEMPGDLYIPAGAFSYYWITNDQFILLNDHFGDVWKLDLYGSVKPENITNGFGRRNNVRLLITENSDKYLDENKSVFLSGTGYRSKVIGIYKKHLNKPGDPELVTTEYSLYSKALNADVHLFRRASLSEFPNFFIAKDLKNFIPLTQKHPEKKYNWFTAEKISWLTHSKVRIQGILFKPENFDPNHKYPVIFAYYDNAGVFLNSNDLSVANINIPFYVSNGYLVVVPDIYYATCMPSGESSYNSIVSAAEYLSQKPFVDSKKLGITGYSFGGYETNYLVTHSTIFAAASASFGMTDLISLSLGIRDDNDVQTTMQTSGQMGQVKLWANLWQRPDLYLRNSAVFYADRVTTPLLMVHNYNDLRVQFKQGYELFTSLRRLGKKVWMLQYDGASHFNGFGNDFVIRQKQFFDHYLKNIPAPIWMTRGIPAKQKGVTSGFEVDSKVKEPPPSPLIGNEILLPVEKAIIKHQTTINNEGRVVNVTKLKKSDDLKAVNARARPRP